MKSDKQGLHAGHVLRWMVALTILATAPIGALGADYVNYVSQSGSDGNGGTSWTDAYGTLTNAIAQASNAIGGGASGASVYVDSGTYTQSVQLVVTQPIAIIGKGGVGVADALQSIIHQGSATDRVLFLSNATARVQGVVLENGYLAKNGAGGNVYLAEGTITNCVLRDNRYYIQTGGGWGVSGSQKGGGIFMSGGLVVDSVISGNGVGHYVWGYPYATYSYGGGAYISGGTLRRSVVLGNHNRVHVDGYRQPADGAGVYLDGGSAIVENCLVTANQGYNSSDIGTAKWRGAGVFLNAGTLRNSTVVANRIDSSSGFLGVGTRDGGGVYQAGGTCVNCIAWDNVVMTTNTAAVVMTNYYGVAKNVTYSLAPELTSGSGNQTVDPLFVDVALGDYRLDGESLAVNAGLNQDWMTGALDLAGTPRIQARRVDIGAYEWVAPSGTLLSIR